MRAVSFGVCIGTIVAGSAVAAQPVLFQPDSATAGSEFSASYDIGNAIDGSGLTLPLCLTQGHATYTTHNHWTTKAGALNAGTAFADFVFADGATVGSFILWNHRSDGVAADPGYAVTLFDLELFDEAGGLLHALRSQPAVPGVSAAQTFSFAPVDHVHHAKLTILDNNGSPNYTGVAEVAFAAAATCPGDLSGDQAVNSTDLNVLLGDFGAGSAGDLNCDGLTNSSDLNILLGLFGNTCN